MATSFFLLINGYFFNMFTNNSRLPIWEIDMVPFLFIRTPVLTHPLHSHLSSCLGFVELSIPLKRCVEMHKAIFYLGSESALKGQWESYRILFPVTLGHSLRERTRRFLTAVPGNRSLRSAHSPVCLYLWMTWLKHSSACKGRCRFFRQHPFSSFTRHSSSTE